MHAFFLEISDVWLNERRVRVIGDHSRCSPSFYRFGMCRAVVRIFVFVSVLVWSSGTLTVFVVVAKVAFRSIFARLIVVFGKTGYPGTGAASSRCYGTWCSGGWYSRCDLACCRAWPTAVGGCARSCWGIISATKNDTVNISQTCLKQKSSVLWHLCIVL